MKTRPVPVRFDDETLDKIRAFARKIDRPVSSTINRMVKKFLTKKYTL